MGFNSFAVELKVDVSASRMWHACVKDAHNALPKILPEQYASIEYLEGGTCEKGSVRLVKYATCYKHYTFTKEKIEEIDHENYYVKLKIIDGGLLNKMFHHHHNTLRIIPGTEEGTCFVNWCMEYDLIGDHKFHETCKHEIIHMLRDVEAYLSTHEDYNCMYQCE